MSCLCTHDHIAFAMKLEKLLIIQLCVDKYMSPKHYIKH